MKERIYTMPLTDAFRADDECPFCFIEKNLEEHTMDFVLGPGASYMEDDIRAETDKTGFCRIHYKKMYEYGNRLGAGLILKTHFQKLYHDFEVEAERFSPSKSSFFHSFKKIRPEQNQKQNNISQWAAQTSASCYICQYNKETFQRYLETFFELFKKSAEFKEQLRNCKGFCIPHFGDLSAAGDLYLSDKEKKEFFDLLIPLMKNNLSRIYQDLDWFCDKFDYKNKDADWKNSRDALQRSMQKAGGGYPAAPPYIMDR